MINMYLMEWSSKRETHFLIFSLISNLEKYTPNYKFTFQDIINCRKKTLGIVQFKFEINDIVWMNIF
jgi:hypothetical protein